MRGHRGALIGNAIACAASELAEARNGNNNVGARRTALIGTRAMRLGHTGVAIGRGVTSHRRRRCGA
jgi:hypothetical protein